MSDDNVTDMNDILKNKKVMSIEEAREYQAALKKRVENAIKEVETSADESTEEYWLDYMNNKYAFIESIGGKPFIKCYTYNETFSKDTVEFRTPDSIYTIHSNQKVSTYKNNGQLDIVPVGKWWIEHPRRKEYSAVVFDPSKDKEIKTGNHLLFNLWEGLTITPAKGSWKRALKHIYKILCNSEREKFTYFIKWLAWLFQNPDKRAEVAVIFKGKQGAGKGFIWEQLVTIFGIHGMNVSSAEHFSGKFNTHLRSLVFLFADEAYYPGNKEAEGKIKELITSPRIATEPKFKDTILSLNRLHIGMATNNDFIIPSEDDSVRRYFVNKVEDTYAFNNSPNSVRKRYFDRLWGEMENGGREAMVYDLLSMSLGDWHPRHDIPDTEELQRQKIRGIRNEHRIVATFLEDGEFPGEYNLQDNNFSVSMDALMNRFRKIEIGVDKIPPRRIGEVFRALGVEKRHTRQGNRWIFPDLCAMRQAWDNRYIKMDWDDQQSWLIVKQEF